MQRREFLGTAARAALAWTARPDRVHDMSPLRDSPIDVHLDKPATDQSLQMECLNTRVSTTVSAGESLGLWGAIPGPRIAAKAIAAEWRTRSAQTRELIFEGSNGVAYASCPFDDGRPFRLEFATKTKLPILWVNRPRVDWVEHETVYCGQRLRLFGRNLHNVSVIEMRAADQKPFFLEQLSAFPYMLKSRVPSCQSGSYELWVDGISIARLDVIEEATDPLGLQVAWANRFRWDQVFTTALQNSLADSTKLLQDALDEAAAKGGGVVQLPAGEFGIRHLEIPAHVVLMGAGQGITLLRYLGGEPAGKTWDAPSSYMGGKVVTWESAHPMLSASSGPVGVARLSLVSDVMQPDDGRRRIDGYVQGLHIEAVNSSFVFASDLDINLVSGSGIRAEIGADAVVQRCRVAAPCTGVGVNALRPDGRVAIRNCRITNQQRPLVVLFASNSVFENNHLIGNNKFILWCGGEHRIAELGPSLVPGVFTHQYIADNLAEGIFGTPNQNDGEGLNFQHTTRLAYGPVSTADANSASDDSQSYEPGLLKGSSIVIVRGSGLGQIRRVTDNSATRIEVQPAWDIVPDAASAYTVDKYIAAYGCIIVGNSISGVKKPAIDLYGKNYDNWIQGNQISNAGGIFLNATENTQQRRLDMAYFNVVRDNVIIGQATDPATGLPQQKLIATDHGLNWGIRIGNISRGNGKNVLPSVSIYANEIRNNTISGPMPDARAAGIILGVDTLAEHVSSGIGNIVEGNEVHDSPVGVRLGTHVDETRIRSNRFLLLGPNTSEVQRGGPL